MVKIPNFISQDYFFYMLDVYVTLLSYLELNKNNLKSAIKSIKPKPFKHFCAALVIDKNCLL